MTSRALTSALGPDSESAGWAFESAALWSKPAVRCTCLVVYATAPVAPPSRLGHAVVTMRSGDSACAYDNRATRGGWLADPRGRLAQVAVTRAGDTWPDLDHAPIT